MPSEGKKPPTGSCAPFLAIALDGFVVLAKTVVSGGEGQQIVQPGHRHHRHAVFLLHLLYRRVRAVAAPFLPVQPDDHAAGLGAGGADQGHRFANGGAGGNHVVHDQHPPPQRRSDEPAAFAVILGFLAVERHRQVTTVFGRQCAGEGGGQWDALVGRAEQHVPLQVALLQGAGVAMGGLPQGAAAVQGAGVEEIRAFPAGFEGESAEFQGLSFQCKLKEGCRVFVHGWSPVGAVARGRYCTLLAFVAQEAVMRVISFNANGLRAAARKGFFHWLEDQRADVVCLQELKAQQHQLEGAEFHPAGFHVWYHPAEKKGYSGVGLYCREQPDRVVQGMGMEDVDREGRYLQADYGRLSVISLYMPSGSSKEERQAFKYTVMDRFLPFLENLRDQGREIILCGDINIAHREIDLKNWRSNQKNSGFLPEERAWMDRLLAAGFVDAFRVVKPEVAEYTWWSNRGRAWENNTGWRIDYQIITPALAEHVLRADIYRDRRFSDHAPLTLDYDFQPDDFRTGGRWAVT